MLCFLLWTIVCVLGGFLAFPTPSTALAQPYLVRSFINISLPWKTTQLTIRYPTLEIEEPGSGGISYDDGTWILSPGNFLVEVYELITGGLEPFQHRLNVNGLAYAYSTIPSQSASWSSWPGPVASLTPLFLNNTGNITIDFQNQRTTTGFNLSLPYGRVSIYQLP